MQSSAYLVGQSNYNGAQTAHISGSNLGNNAKNSVQNVVTPGYNTGQNIFITPKNIGLSSDNPVHNVGN